MEEKLSNILYLGDIYCFHLMRYSFSHENYIFTIYLKVSVRVINKDESKTEWSDKFSLTTIGSEGVFSCKDGHRELKVSHFC